MIQNSDAKWTYQSPMLFHIVDDMLAIMIKRAKNDGLIEEVIPHLVDRGLSVL
jgi:hypothetical protein